MDVREIFHLFLHWLSRCFVCRPRHLSAPTIRAYRSADALESYVRDFSLVDIRANQRIPYLFTSFQSTLDVGPDCDLG